MSAVLQPVVEVGVLRVLRRIPGHAQDTYILNPEAARFTDAALASWCDGDRFRFGEHVERYPHEVHVTVYRD